MASAENSNRSPLDSLTNRERQVLQSLASGKSNKETALTLNLSVKTVETYRERIMMKLDAHSLSDLIHLAIRHGLVQA
jgi:DNA-binding NarL/FixJ family response regulator